MLFTTIVPVIPGEIGVESVIVILCKEASEIAAEMGVYDGKKTKFCKEIALIGSIGSLNKSVTETESSQKLLKMMGELVSIIMPATLFIAPGVPPAILSEGFQLELTGQVKSISTFSTDQPPSFLKELPYQVSLYITESTGNPKGSRNEIFSPEFVRDIEETAAHLP